MIPAQRTKHRRTRIALALVLAPWLLLATLTVVPPLNAQEIRNRDSAAANDNARLAPPGVSPAQGFGANGTNQPTGVLITRVLAGSPAQQAGLEVRDTVLTVDGYQVGIVNGVTYDLEREVLARAGRGRPITLLVKDWRTSNLTNISVNLNAGGGIAPPVINPIEGQMAQVNAWYNQYLQRDPFPTESNAWRDSLIRGGLTMDDVRAYILGSTEFYERIGRNNDITFIYALCEKVQGRQPTQAELSRYLTNLNQSAGNRVAFVKDFLTGRPQVQPPAPQALSTKEVSNSLKNYQKQMASFAAWGLYAEQSSLIFRSNASLKTIEQYEIPGRQNRPEQQRLAEEVLGNCNRLNELAVQIRERAQRTNQRLVEANRLVDEANQLKRWADQLLGQIRQPR